MFRHRASTLFAAATSCPIADSFFSIFDHTSVKLAAQRADQVASTLTAPFSECLVLIILNCFVNHASRLPKNISIPLSSFRPPREEKNRHATRVRKKAPFISESCARPARPRSRASSTTRPGAGESTALRDRRSLLYVSLGPFFPDQASLTAFSLSIDRAR